MEDTGTLRPAVFFDRDGTLNEEVNYLHRVEDFAWVPGAPEAVRRLNDVGLLVIVVTNQAGIARGYYSEEDMHDLHQHMQALLAESGAHVDAVYHSPYHPAGTVAAYRRDSNTRKPGTGLFEQALREWPIDPVRSFVVGDKNSDIEPGLALGMTTILVETGYGKEAKKTTSAHYVVADVAAAVDLIVSKMDRSGSGKQGGWMVNS